ncbi:MAG: haloacid dehalogenase [Actinomycetota bacterium]|nr:haloacid dehalogenase [Actinomycetota bacterium]
MTAPELGRLEQSVRAELDDKFAARERAIVNSRKVIRASANAIRALHRNEAEEAERLVGEAASLLGEMASVLGSHPDIYHAGFLSDAAKEYAEARLTAALVSGKPLPLPDELEVDVAPYLNGLGEAVGELRRRMLDLLRAGRLEEAEDSLAAMGEIYDLLASLDYPDAMTGGLRRTTDVARALIERSRADLTLTVVQERLRRELAEHVGE